MTWAENTYIHSSVFCMCNSKLTENACMMLILKAVRSPFSQLKSIIPCPMISTFLACSTFSSPTRFVSIGLFVRRISKV